MTEPNSPGPEPGDDATQLNDDQADATEAPTGGKAATPSRGRAVRPLPGEPPAAPSEVAAPLRDRPSQAFVIAVALIFALILLNGVFLGRGGILTPLPTESPSLSAEPSPSESASASAEASPTEVASASAAASASAGASASASPSTEPSASGTPASSPTPSTSP